MTREAVFPVFLSLGSNIEPRDTHLQQARQALEKYAQITRVSSIYETDPWGYEAQERFLNQVVECRTSLSPGELLTALKEIEQGVGRTPTFRYGPREIDLDILLYGAQMVEEPALTIPHPRMAERAFVLVPLAELAPRLVIPGRGKSIPALLAGLDASTVRLWEGGSHA